MPVVVESHSNKLSISTVLNAVVQGVGKDEDFYEKYLGLGKVKWRHMSAGVEGGG